MIKEKFMPPDSDEICWQVGAETFTRKEVYYLLWTQRAMIGNDIKSLRFNTSYDKLQFYNSRDIYEVLDNPRIPEY